MTALVRVAALTNFDEVARQFGLDARKLLAKAGLSRTTLADPEQEIRADVAAAILEEAAAASGCESFGLRMAALRQTSDLGVISLMLTHQPTLRDSLNMLIRYRYLMNKSLVVQMEDMGRNVILREELVTSLAIPARQATYLATGTLLRLCLSQLGQQWRPKSVHFTHDAPADIEYHRRFFGCKLEFGSNFNGIVSPAADFDRPNPHADPALVRYAQRYVDTLSDSNEPELELEVRRAIYLLLPLRRATIEQVAPMLGMSVRTLQRRLDECGEAFTPLVNGVRRDLVKRYLVNASYSLGQIAELLGYAQQGAFTRWFAAQFGMAPGKWREGGNDGSH